MNSRELLFGTHEDATDPRVRFFDDVDDSPFRVFPVTRPRRDVSVLLSGRIWATVGADGSTTFADHPALTVAPGDAAGVLWHAREAMAEVGSLHPWEERVWGEPLSDGSPARWFAPRSGLVSEERPIKLQQRAREVTFKFAELAPVLVLLRLAVHVARRTRMRDLFPMMVAGTVANDTTALAVSA